MPGVTKEQIQAAREIDLFTYLQFHEPGVLKRDGIISGIRSMTVWFYKVYGMEIEDKRTVYGECTYRLVPREDEPSVCLMHDWIYLPSAKMQRKIYKSCCKSNIFCFCYCVLEASFWKY